jgi:hypothetical protein
VYELQSVAKRKPSPARENRVIAGIAHDRWLGSLNATMNKSPHIEIIAETSKRLRGFSLANMICSPWLEGSLSNPPAWTDWTVRERSAYVLGKNLN